MSERRGFAYQLAQDIKQIAGENVLLTQMIPNLTSCVTVDTQSRAMGTQPLAAAPSHIFLLLAFLYNFRIFFG